MFFTLGAKEERDIEKLGGVKGSVEFEHEYFFELKIKLNFSNKPAQQFNNSALLVDFELDQFHELEQTSSTPVRALLGVLYVSMQVGIPCIAIEQVSLPSNLSHVPL